MKVNGHEVTDKELLNEGMRLVSDAMCIVNEMKSSHGNVLFGILKTFLVCGKHVIGGEENSAGGIDNVKKD